MGLFAGITVAGLIQGALIGAAIGAVVGGITAAIMGGDIGKGILFGAVGGAVTGGLMYGAEVALGNLGVAANSSASWTAPAGQEASVSGFWESAVSSGADVSVSGTGVVTQGTAQAAGKGGFFSNLWTDLKGGFSSPSSAGTEFGAQAFGAAIKGTADVYGGKKKIESAEKMQEKKFGYDMAMADKAQEGALAQIAARGEYSGGSGAGAAGPDYTIEQLMGRDTNAAEQERTTVLAKVDAELQGQKALKQQEFAEAGANREMMAATAGALRGASSRTGSSSTETIVDVQDRIRAGENAQGAPNTGVIPPVTYVPPEQYV